MTRARYLGLCAHALGAVPQTGDCTRGRVAYPEVVGVKRILVVDDEALVANALRRTLSAAGFDVHAVYSGATALEAVERLQPDLVLTDLNMNGMSGEALLVELKQRAPHIRRALISASFDADTLPPASCAPCMVIAKPWAVDDLVQRLRDLLGVQGD